MARWLSRLAAAMLIVLAIIQPALAADVAGQRTNVVILLADDLGFGDPSCHGGGVATPRIDRLISQGVELQTFLVQPVCSPTRAALLTGRDPARVGVNPQVVNARVGEMMNPKETTLAEVFKSAGRTTALMGKWHLGYAPSSPNLKGFDEFYGFLGAATSYLNRPSDQHTQWMLNEKPQPDPGYSTDLIRNRAIKFIGENSTRPFFLYVPFNAVHNPVESAAQYTARVTAKITDEHARARAGMLIALDDAVGAIVDAIDKQGLGERTIVVFFSDNGPTPDGSAGSFRGRKHTLYEGGVRSPAVVRWTGKLPAGKRTNAMLAVEDLFPTLLKMTDVAIPKDLTLDGKDFSACLTSDQPSPREQRCWLWMNCDSIRTPRHKLIRFADHRELYDLELDPAESKNIADESAELADELQLKLDNWQASVPIYPTHVAVRGANALKADPAKDVLELRAKREDKAGGAANAQPMGFLIGTCDRFAIRSGDRLEYDLLIADDSASQGIAVALSPPLNTKKAQRGGAVDEDEAGGGSPAEAGGVVAKRGSEGQWTRRTLGLANFGGKMMEMAWLNVDAKKSASYHVYVDNVIVRRADGSTIELYRDGEPKPQRRGFSDAYSDVSIKVTDAANAKP